MLEIKFVKQKRTIQAQPGETIREAAIRNKLSIYPHILKILNCRGRGLCTSCPVEIMSGNVDSRNDTENNSLAKKLKKNPNIRLACQIEVKDNLVVQTHV